jgi:arsenite oxidase large subunit
MGFKSFDWKDSNEILEEAARFSHSGVFNYHALAVHAKCEGINAHKKTARAGHQWHPDPNPGDRRQTGRISTTQSSSARKRARYGSQTVAATRPGIPVSTTCESPTLAKRWPWPCIVIHPDDAAHEGIESGDLVEGHNDTIFVQRCEPIGARGKDLPISSLMERGHIQTTTGRFVAVAILLDEIKSGVAKAAFNYPGSMANSVCHAMPDPVSDNYRRMLGCGVRRQIGESEFKHNLLEMSLKPRPIT